MHTPGWPWICSNSPVSASLVLDHRHVPPYPVSFVHIRYFKMWTTVLCEEQSAAKVFKMWKINKRRKNTLSRDWSLQVCVQPVLVYISNIMVPWSTAHFTAFYLRWIKGDSWLNPCCPGKENTAPSLVSTEWRQARRTLQSPLITPHPLPFPETQLSRSPSLLWRSQSLCPACPSPWSLYWEHALWLQHQDWHKAWCFPFRQNL